MDVFEEVSPPENVQILPLRWVFTPKLNTKGFLDRFKARLCARGDLQENPGTEVYAATGAYRTFRILMALVAAFGLLCESADVTNAFLNSLLPYDVYVQCPPGFKVPGKVWKLKRALYGLKEAPKLWFQNLSSFLTSHGYESCPDEPCLLINKSTGVIIFLYVDDFLLTGPKHQQAEINNLKRLLNAKYGLKDYGPATSFLNIVISRDLDNHSLTISQEPYIDKLIQKFHLQGMIQSKISTPLTPGIKLVPHQGQATVNEIKEYQTKTGSVLYAAIVTRPDIAYAASLLCQFNTNPSLDHQREANRVLGYLAQTKALVLEFSTQLCTQSECPSRIFEVASDASFADDVATRLSTQGFIMKLFNGPIVWQSAKQKTVTTSTTEAELLALSNTARETVAICRLFSQMDFKPDERAAIACDNMQTIGLILKERPELTTRLRHVDIHHFWLRQAHRQGLIEVEWKATADMIADGLTKALGPQKHLNFIKQLGLRNITTTRFERE